MVHCPWASRLMVNACKQRRICHIDMPRPAGTSFSKQCGVLPPLLNASPQLRPPCTFTPSFGRAPLTRVIAP